MVKQYACRIVRIIRQVNRYACKSDFTLKLLDLPVGIISAESTIMALCDSEADPSCKNFFSKFPATDSAPSFLYDGVVHLKLSSLKIV